MKMAASTEHVFALVCGNFLQNDALCSTLKAQLRIISDLELISGCKTSGLQALTGQVNAALSSSKNRLEGLCLLKCLLGQCSTELFQEHAITWLRLLLQTLQSYDPALSLQLCCKVTSKLLHHMSCFAEMSRDVSTSLIPQLITALLAAKPQWMPSALDCLCSCLKYYPGPCGPFKNKIENLLTTLLGSNNDSSRQSVSECYALLARAGGGGSMGIKHTEAWSVSCEKLVASLHVVLNQLYDGIELDGTDYQVSSDSMLEMPLVSEAEPQRTLDLNSRFETLCLCLQKLLSIDFPATVKVPLQDIIALICRTLAISPKQLAIRGTQEMLILMSVLPQLQQQAYRLLSSLITGCGSYACVHSSVINKLFLQTLNWSSVPEKERVYGQDRPYRALRCAVYECIQQWVTLTGPASGVEFIASDLWPHLLEDAQPQQDTMKIDSKSVKAPESTNSGSGKKKKGGSAYLGHLTSHRKLNLSANSDVCLQSLQVLRLLILKVGSFVKPKQHKMLQEFLIPTLLKIQQAHATSIPYTLPACRQALYRLLQASVLVPHPQWPAPTQCAIAIFRKGQQDCNIQVSAACSEALVICDSIIRPRAPTLHAPQAIHTEALSQTTKPQENGYQMDIGTPTISFRSPSKLNESLSDQLLLRSGTTIQSGMFQGSVDKASVEESIQGASDPVDEEDGVEDMETSKDEQEGDEDEDEDDPDWVTDEEEEVDEEDVDDDDEEEKEEEGGDGEDGSADADHEEKESENTGDGDESKDKDDGWVTDEEVEIIGGTPSPVKKPHSLAGEDASPSVSTSSPADIPPSAMAASTETDSMEDTLKRKLDFVEADAAEESSPACKKAATSAETDDTDMMLAAFIDAPPDSD